MYSVDPKSAALWQTLLVAVIQEAGVPITLVEHPAPAPLEELWQRPDLGAVFMCGLPFSRTLPQPALIAAPIPRVPPVTNAIRAISNPSLGFPSLYFFVALN